ncbi:MULTISPECIES: MG2 domain-containing protein [unclassified Mucilaginibacter]|uniref:alpha-2-macroglobulin family protein n=1 Tax=unclassified Mucilaginibacter TaxID=2617802 RepID=UPI002AC8DA11|nr:MULTISPECIES: MG2 domain-containing protein [unclassified Mucilaginibacter]MEB0261276.1 MG2 domain-containing protein [Mucilaginibacter sp. 10I4]MEB0279100.1 MG2 domain-containing protein [Mucilaginibacter sp. 10B2]MEB0299881.1 MG2 domain-containing protein [Mucilaginibacter sp. 5C4]WPX22278.1 MG2 domain-containing protein [Mucilaginibacter sp. 5C4]
MNYFANLFRSRRGQIIVSVSLILIALVIFFARQHQRNKQLKVDAAFSKYIESYTTGVISKQSTIRIKLAGEVQVSHAQNEELKDGIFDFSPSVKGKAYWIDDRTIEFRPAAAMNIDKKYTANFNLGKIIKVDGDFEHFKFGFQTIKPDFSITFAGLQSESATSGQNMKLIGNIQTADGEDQSAVEKLLDVNYASPVKISWQHNSVAKSHQFTITKITRTTTAKPLTVNWDGDKLDIDKKGNQEFRVPALGEFKVLDIKAVQDNDQYVSVQFSDPIMVGQELSGLIGINNSSDLAYTIDGSIVKVYAPERMQGNFSVFVNEGVQDIYHRKIKTAFTANVFFENREPAVTIPGKGVILPDSGKLMMPFEAVNLNAVDVTIIKIYENNIPQYFQNNGFDGGYELRHVGKPIVQKTIRLDTDKGLNLTKKNRFMLDVDQLMRAEPGAIYRVIIGFRKDYSLYNCSAGKLVAKSGDDEYNNEGGEYAGDNLSKINDEDDAFWQRYDNYYPEGYNWQERNNPCTESYFSKQRWATRNIIASNIGLIAKRGNDNIMTIAVTNILSAEPMSGVELELLDYQKQVIFKTKSDGNGMATFSMKRKPYLLVAKQGKERGYLKLDDGSSLPLSRFNVGGEQVQNGLKGFLYGERGVWRPGDSIFTTFILEDKLKTLPADHPVEFELYNPNGQLYRKLTRTSSVDGFYSFHVATETSSPTGNWNARIKVGGATFEKKIKVETIMPNRLKLKLDFGGATELTKGSGANGTLSAQWLFGGIAQNLNAKVDAFLSSQTTSFKGYEDYNFDDPTLAFNTQTQTVFEGKLNENGVASVKTNINVEKQAPGQLRANFVVKVFEPGGNFSLQQASMPYNVYEGYVGIKTPKGSDMSGMLVTDKTHVIEIADVDTKGHGFAGSRSVELELYKIQWRWWWDETGNELSNFTQDRYNKLIKTETVQLQNGKGKWNLKINQADWGRYLIRIKDPQTGHSTGKIIYADWPNWSERLQNTDPTEAAMLSFTSNKTNYKVGEEATLTIPTGGDGRALISFENGSKVLKTTWIDTKKGETRYSFNVDETMAPNVFVNVTLLQRHAQTVNDLPIRMYGAIPLNVDNPETILKPVISMPDKIRPETTSAITVSEASGKEMTYTIAIVDEGLLDITNYKTPDPHESFYAREALGVKTWDLFDYVIGAFGGGLERILSIGGDGTNGTNKNVTVNRFKPVVKFLGPFHLGSGDKQTHQFTLPQYVGSVKAMVIAGHNGAYGTAEKAVAVKKPLMILATLPRVLGPSESVQLPVTVFAMENNIKSVSVQVQSNAFSNLGGNNVKIVKFAKPGDQLVTFDLNVKDFVGVGKVKIIAKAGNETAAYDVELNVRNPNPPVTRVFEKELKPGETYATAYNAIGINGTNKASLEVSGIPPLNLAKRLGYLIAYPHGCVEQTISAAFPQLYLGQLLDLTPRQKAESERNIKLAINRLNGFRVQGGGLSYWPDGGNADEWGTNYAGHFLLAAQAKGYSLPSGFIDEWKKYQKQKAVNWSPDPRTNIHGYYYYTDLVQAYRLYLLALSGSPELGAMNRLREYQYISVEARWRLAAAYKLAGQPEIGLRMIAGLPTTIKPYSSMYGTYGSDLRDEAMILETLTQLNQQQKASAMVRQVAAKLSQDSWYSTQTTAYSLISIAEYCGINKSGAKLSFNYNAGAAKGNINAASYLWQQELAANGGKVTMKNTGTNKLYVRLIQQGQPSSGQDVKTYVNPDVMQMRVAYFTLGGKTIDPTSLKQGSDFVAQVTIKNPGKRGRYDNLALTQIFPSGWEILNSRMLNNDEAFKSSPSDYRDIRDDRVNTYFSLVEGKEVTYYVMLNAAYEGKYYLPAAYCEAMYNHDINALIKGQWVEVVK